MEIIYVCIAHNTDIVAEYPTAKREMKQVISLVLQHMPQQDHKRTLEHSPVNIHYHQNRLNREQNFVVLCVAHQDFSFRVSYKFIEEVEKQYKDKYLQTGNEPPRKQVRNMLRSMIKSYKKNDKDKYNRLKKDIALTKNRMLDNVDRILANAEKLDSLKDRSSDLVDESMAFRNRSRKMKHMMCVENSKILILLAAILLFVVLGGVWIGCKFPTFSRCLPKSKSSNT